MQAGGTSGFVELLHDTGSAEAHAVVNGLQPGKWCLPSTREPARRERTRAWREGELSRRDRGLRAAGTSSESRHGRLADWARREGLLHVAAAIEAREATYLKQAKAIVRATNRAADTSRRTKAYY